MDCADAVSSRILYEPREGCSRRQRSDSGRIAPHPVFAQRAAVFALRKSRPRGARRCCFQLLLGFCIVLFSDKAVAIRLAETALTHSSITPSIDSLPPHTHAFGPPGLGRIWARRSTGKVSESRSFPVSARVLLIIRIGPDLTLSLTAVSALHQHSTQQRILVELILPSNRDVARKWLSFKVDP